MERAAWAVLTALHLSQYLKYVYGVMFMFFLLYEARRGRGH